MARNRATLRLSRTLSRPICWPSKPHGVEGETFNIACGESVDLRAVLQFLTEFSGNQVEPEYQAPRAGDVKHSLADISKAERMLGYRPVIPFREGLQANI